MGVALSVDTLFVFLIIMAGFISPREDQQRVLLLGIVFALVSRTVFIFVGDALINQFAWVFHLFGLNLLLTAGHMLKSGSSGDSYGSENSVAELARLPEDLRAPRRRQDVHRRERHASADPDAAGDGGHRWQRHPVRARLDPGDLRAHPEHLHRLHRQRVLPLSLGVILGVLVVTVAALRLSKKGSARTAIGNARHAREYLGLDYTADTAERERVYDRLLDAADQIRSLGPEYRAMVCDEPELMSMVEQARRQDAGPWPGVRRAVVRGSGTR